MIKDTQQLQGFNNIKLPKLKGHVKITLHNPTTGKNEVVEGDNIVTNAVRDIMANNYMGCVDYSQMFPLWSKWYGGILLYQAPHPTTTVGGEEVLDPDKYYPQSDLVNHLVAHAGQTAIGATDDDLRRGNPVTSQYVHDSNSMKMVWEWSTSHGNGTISALSLTHTDTGDAGLGSNTTAFQAFQPLANLTNSVMPQTGSNFSPENLAFQYDENHGVELRIGDGTDAGDEGYYANHISFQTSKITLLVHKKPYSKSGLFDELNISDDTTLTIKKVVPTHLTFYANPCYYFDYENKQLWLFANLTQVISGTSYIGSGWDKSWACYTKLDLSDLSVAGDQMEIDYGNVKDTSAVSHRAIHSDTSALAPLGVALNNSYGGSKGACANIVYSNGSFYFPCADQLLLRDNTINTLITGYKRINFVNQGDQDTITYLEPGSISTPENMLPYTFYGDGVFVSDGVVLNGLTGYKCARYINRNAYVNTYQVLLNQGDKPISYAVLTAVSTFFERRILANKMLNTTLFNLPTPVTKTSSQAMTVEYTLTEASENA